MSFFCRTPEHLTKKGKCHDPTQKTGIKALAYNLAVYQPHFQCPRWFRYFTARFDLS